MNINSLISSLALATQLLSVYYSIRLMRYTEKRVITIVFFLVACLMALRRLISLVSFFSQGAAQVNLFGETVALFISLLILFGIISLARIFKSEEENKKAAASAELRYRSLFDQSPDGVLLINAKGDIVDFNKEVNRQLGYTREEFSKLRISDIDPVENPADIKTRFEKIIKHGKDEFEVKHKTKQGEIRDVLAIVQTLELSGQTFFHTIWRDVTERKQAENKIWESRSTLKQILDSVPQSIFWKDRDSVYLGCNKVFARAIGIDDPEKIIGKTDFDLPWPRNEAEAYRTDDRAVVTTGRAKMHIVEPLEQADGSRLWIDTTKVPLVDKQGDIYGVLGVYDNITERKRTEDALKESEFFFKESQRVAAIGSYKTDFIKGAWESSEVLDTIFGIDKDYNRSVQGWLDIVHPDDSDMMDQYLREEVIAKRKPFSKEYRIIRKNNGETRWVYGLGEVKFDSNGKILSMIGTIQDITERKKAEEDHKKLEAQLRHAQKMEAVGTLAGGVAHDFNNILNVILGYGTMVMDKLETGSPSKEHMSEVLIAADRAANLTKRLLVFSRKQAVEVKPININELILGLQKMLVRIIRESVAFKLDLADRPLIVLADAGQIEQVLINLATNATDAMQEGGRLTIGTDLKEIDDEYVAAYGYGKPGKYVLITVADTGHGINAETQKKIFEPFFTTKGIGEGTGLGLAISYGIIKQHNGYIKVYSEPGQGTVFKIYLPLGDEATVPDKETEAAFPVKGGNETILVAEDDASLRNLARIVLESFGYTVISAEDGEDAIAKFMENRDRISLALLDMIMPKKNGKEVSETIRKISPQIKTLFVSGYTMDIIKTDELREAGFDFIQKPFPPQALLIKVREVLDR